jgi:hypothetical protein
MSGLDHPLIYEARKFIDGANFHRVNTWIFCYETSEPNSVRRERYEVLLREFVATKRIVAAGRAQAAIAREYSVRARSHHSTVSEAITDLQKQRRKFKTRL